MKFVNIELEEVIIKEAKNICRECWVMSLSKRYNKQSDICGRF
jgi:hypothetical protein